MDEIEKIKSEMQTLKQDFLAVKEKVISIKPLERKIDILERNFVNFVEQKLYPVKNIEEYLTTMQESISTLKRKQEFLVRDVVGKISVVDSGDIIDSETNTLFACSFGS